jgi:hypothetical protein
MISPKEIMKPCIWLRFFLRYNICTEDGCTTKSMDYLAAKLAVKHSIAIPEEWEKETSCYHMKFSSIQLKVWI